VDTTLNQIKEQVFFLVFEADSTGDDIARNKVGKAA
jgi:hypothetical protein